MAASSPESVRLFSSLFSSRVYALILADDPGRTLPPVTASVWLTKFRNIVFNTLLGASFQAILLPFAVAMEVIYSANDVAVECTTR